MEGQKRIFWFLQISGWVLYWSVNIMTLWIRGNLNENAFIRYTSAALGGFLATLILRYIYKKFNPIKLPLFFLLLLGLGGSFLTTNLLIWITNVVRFPFWGIRAFTINPTLQSYISRSFWWGIPVLGWSAIYFGIKFWQEWNFQSEKTKKANALAQAAQLQMMRYRIKPHFLFNALNSIRALISEDRKLAKKMVTELSEFLRYSLVSKNYRDVPFKEEIESVKHFFNIQKMRYENKLEVFYEIDPDSEEFPVLSFLIHPLAENAIEYGLKTSPLPLKVFVTSNLEKGMLDIEVRNTGTWTEPDMIQEKPAVDSGLNNVRKQLREAYGDNFVFEVKETGEHVVARITIPGCQRKEAR